MNTELVKELRNIPIFADLSDEKLGWLADHSKVETAEAGEIVIRENEPAESMVIKRKRLKKSLTKKRYKKIKEHKEKEVRGVS